MMYRFMWMSGFFLALVISIPQAHAQLRTFQKEYKTKAFTLCFDIAPTPDGGYVYCGMEDIPTIPNSGTSYITKLDCQGEPEWTKRFGQVSSLDNTEHLVTVLPDSSLILCSSEGVTGTFDILVVRLDPSGNTIWKQRYGGPAGDIQGGVTVLDDGHLAVVGSTNSFGINTGSAFRDIYVLKINTADGSLIWTRTFGIQGATSRAHDVVALSGGGLALTGQVFHASTVGTWAPLLQLDANGDVVDLRFFGQANRNTIGMGISRAADGGILLSGSSNILGVDWFDPLQFPMILKVDQQGDLVWGSILEGTPNVSGIGGLAYTPVDNGDTVGVAIETYFYANQTADPTKRVLALLDATDGFLLNARQYNVEGGQFPVMKPDIDGGYIMSAFTDENNGSGPNDQFWVGPILNKLDASFSSGCNETDRTSQSILHQPVFTTNTSIAFDLIANGGATLGPNAAADSFAVALPIVETFCEELHDVTAEISWPDLVCGELTVPFQATISYPLYDLTWDLGDGTVINSGQIDSLTHTYADSGTYIITLTIDLCETTVVHIDTLILSDIIPDATIAPAGPFCITDAPTTLNAATTGGLWSGPGITDPVAGEFDPNSAGFGDHLIIYQVDQAGCQASDSLVLTVSDQPQVNLGPDTLICAPSVTLDPQSTAMTYLWSTGVTTSTLTVNQSGTYAVTVSNGGCQATDTIDLELASVPVINLGGDQTLCAGDSLVLTVPANAGTILWSDGSSAPSTTVTSGGPVSVQVSSICGLVEDIVTITLEDCGCAIYMPNAFSPNLDGINDGYGPQLPPGCTYADVTFSIFNRWGNAVFTSNAITDRWSGEFRGKLASSDVYVYVLRYRNAVGDEKVLRGEFTLVR